MNTNVHHASGHGCVEPGPEKTVPSSTLKSLYYQFIKRTRLVPSVFLQIKAATIVGQALYVVYAVNIQRCQLPGVSVTLCDTVIEYCLRGRPEYKRLVFCDYGF